MGAAMTARCDTEHCRTCGQTYPEFGDGWNGECPTCADRTYAAGEAEQERMFDSPAPMAGQAEMFNPDE